MAAEQIQLTYKWRIGHFITHCSTRSSCLSLPPVPNLIYWFFGGFFKANAAVILYGCVGISFWKCSSYTDLAFHCWIPLIAHDLTISAFPVPLRRFILYSTHSLSTCSLKASKIPSEVIKIYFPHNSPGEHLSSRRMCWVFTTQNKETEKEVSEWEGLKGKRHWDLMDGHWEVTEK